MALSLWKGLVGIGLFALAHAAFSAAQRKCLRDTDRSGAGLRRAVYGRTTEGVSDRMSQEGSLETLEFGVITRNSAGLPSGRLKQRSKWVSGRGLRA